MQLVTVGTKYQIVIPKKEREKMKGIKPGSKVKVHAGNDNVLTVRPALKSWAEESYGYMKDAWKDIDPISELEKMRDEWETKY